MKVDNNPLNLGAKVTAKVITEAKTTISVNTIIYISFYRIKCKYANPYLQLLNNTKIHASTTNITLC